ncbi:hypothetical protein CA600_02330 [Paenibacillus sp. VTT E-133280]|uniref:MerR family DNA-binding transcriptional regulator n=1 Tax=Paenibacillus sp. VTT E-133280 TaxID=1986222 RepID=UPI000B9FD9B3|nr:MerR family DNA-binding transcriptional regulator [Paenibacillus sp. VTT E-133280]OZQ69846.1 hypothetical protein CA600_02330 [Paenibacillus sp. VTT E-133280]
MFIEVNNLNTRMRIGELTKRAGVTPRTIRYYESIGLMPSGEREGTGQHYHSTHSAFAATATCHSGAVSRSPRGRVRSY